MTKTHSCISVPVTSKYQNHRRVVGFTGLDDSSIKVETFGPIKSDTGAVRGPK